MQGKEADAGELVAALVAVGPAEQLVPAADSQECRPAGNRLPERLAQSRQCRRDQLLLSVLAAADVVEVVRTRPQLVAGADRLDLQLVAAPGCPPCQDGDVPAVGIDVQVVRKEVPDGDPHAAASSQYGLTNPRPATRSRKASIAV